MIEFVEFVLLNNMTASCGVCGVECAENAVKCSVCEKAFHLTCIKQDGVKTRTGNKDWKCEECRKDLSSVSSNKSSSSSTALTKEFLVSVLEDFKREVFAQFKNHSTQFDKFQNSLQFLSDSVDKSNKLIEEVKMEYTELKKQNNLILVENKQLKDSVCELQDRLRALEQYSRRANLEISGIPETANENTFALLQDIGKTIGQELESGDVTAAHRVPSFNKRRCPSLVVQFLYRSQRDAWLTSYKKRKVLTAKEVNTIFPSDRVFINEHLSPENKQFLAQVKKRSRELNIKYVWTREGKCYVRRNDGERSFKISKLDELEKV